MILKKRFILFVGIYFLSCQNKIKEEKCFKAISYNEKDTAYLKYSEFENQFFGDYLVIYADKSFELGTVSGEIVGDTLKGRLKYNSRRNSKFTKPIAFLKVNGNLRQGTGMVSYYAQIPFFAKSTIEFPDSLLQFFPIKPNENKDLDQKIQFYKQK